MSLEDIYIGVCESMESKKSELVSLLEDITEPSCPQSGEKFQFLEKATVRIAPFVSNGYVPNAFRFLKRVLAFVLAVHLVPIPPMENVFTPIPTRLFVFIRALWEIRSIGIVSASTVSLRKESLTC